jgi:hypothetical protein
MHLHSAASFEREAMSAVENITYPQSLWHWVTFKRFVMGHIRIQYKSVDVFLNAFRYWHGWMIDSL